MSLRTLNPYYRWVFPWLLDRVSPVVAPERQQLLQRAKGQVLEIGAGTGTSFGYCGEQEAKLYALVDNLVTCIRKNRSPLFNRILRGSGAPPRYSKKLSARGALLTTDYAQRLFLYIPAILRTSRL